MAFNPTKYLKGGSISPTNNILNGVVRGATTGMAGSTTSIATNISSTLYQAGAAINTVRALSSIGTDTAVLRSATNYLVGGAGSIERNDTSSKEFFSSINPVSKIAKAERNSETTIIAVL